MGHRIFSFVVLWSIAALSLWLFGTHAGVALIVILAGLSQWELYSLFEKMGLQPLKGLGVFAGLVITGSAYYLPGLGLTNDLFALMFVLISIVIIAIDLKEGRLRSFLPTLFGLIYIPFLLHYLIKIVKVAEMNGSSAATGIFLAVWVVAVAKSSDVGGLLIGRKIGRTQLSVISPNKTVEGAIGGIATSALVAILLPIIFGSLAPSGLTMVVSLLIAIPIGIASISADLAESAFKRQANVKDSGTFIPGIGGAFDLIDSLLLVSPIAYVLIRYIVY